VIYFDTNYLARLYVREPGFEEVRRLAASDQIACAWHGQAEMQAALHRKLREGLLKARQYTALLGQFSADDRAGAISWLPLAGEVMDRVAKVYAALPATVFLRAADALHLATAAENGFKAIYSNDARLLAAADRFGLSATNVIPA